jgi:hypothetical protein
MNLFILDDDFTLAAQSACDRHVVKMPLETAQMLSCAHHVLDPSNPLNLLMYKRTHENHPCSKWVRANISNYLWTYMFWQAQCDEFTYRYNKVHLSYSKYAEIFATPPANIPFGKRTPFALAMPERYHNDNPVLAYRDYYLNDKAHLLTYTKRVPPMWIEENEVICK